MRSQNVRDARIFMILGAAKCGTTSFFRYVDQHPDLLFSTPKEPVFFESEYERGVDYYLKECFDGWSGQPVISEARTHNLMLPYVAARIRESFPEARLGALLRDPIDRAYSHWWHRYSRSLERLPFREALEENRERLAAGAIYDGEQGPKRWAGELIRNRTNYSTRSSYYLDLGHYAEQLERYLALFPSSQVKVFLFEDLSKDPQALTREAWKFAGLDASHALFDPSSHNTAQVHRRTPLQHQLLRIANHTSQALEKVPALKRWISGSVGGAISRSLAGEPAQRPSMKPEDESWLLEYFEPHNRHLEQLLGRSLPEWFEPQPRRSVG